MLADGDHGAGVAGDPIEDKTLGASFEFVKEAAACCRSALPSLIQHCQVVHRNDVGISVRMGTLK